MPSQREDAVFFSAGVVSIDGEILPVVLSSVTGTLSDTFYLKINSTLGGSRVFKDGETHSCWETRSVEVTKTVTDYPLASFRRLQGGFGTQRWHYEQGGVDFNLAKTGLLWVMTIKRPAMTGLDEHFFELNVPGIQSDDLDAFPSVVTIVPTTVYINGNDGVTSKPLEVSYNKTLSGELHILMDLADSSSAAGTSYAQVVIPVF
ncbi:MAG: hypothetical protein J6T17_08330 [Clostridia bacterium]|nr:hypothetical protein [Clostridia bacterium]